MPAVYRKGNLDTVWTSGGQIDIVQHPVYWKHPPHTCWDTPLHPPLVGSNLHSPCQSSAWKLKGWLKVGPGVAVVAGHLRWSALHIQLGRHDPSLGQHWCYFIHISLFHCLQQTVIIFAPIWCLQLKRSKFITSEFMKCCPHSILIS